MMIRSKMRAVRVSKNSDHYQEAGIPASWYIRGYTYHLRSLPQAGSCPRRNVHLLKTRGATNVIQKPMSQ